MGELVSRTEGANATAATDKATVAIAYNGAGQPTTHTAAGSATTFRYDSAGFRDRVASPNLGTATFEYTKFGELWKRADGKGTTTWSYDALGRPTKRKEPDGVAQWFYDPANARGSLARRCHHESATAMSCDGLTAPDFKETLEYNSGARVRRATTKINAGSPERTYAHSYTYYTDGRLKTVAYPSELTAHYGYNARGYLETLKKDSSTGAALETRTAVDAYGNVTGVTYGNGAATTRVFDPKTGRATDIDTAASGGAKIQDNAYAWRSDGLLQSRASHVGGNNAKLEEFAYDPLGRLKTATTKLSNVTRRTLSQTYDANGNLKTKTSSVGADIGVSAYGYDASKPHRLASATIGRKAHAFSHDADGNITKYDCTSSTCVDDKYIDWNGRNLPERITVGGSRTDETPTSRDEFAYGPDGARHHRKTSHMDGETLRAENTYYVGAFEELLPRPGAAHTSIRQTRVTDSVRHVKTTTVTTAEDGTKKTDHGKVRRLPAQGPPGLRGGRNGRERRAHAGAGLRPVRGPAQGGLDGCPDGVGAPRAGGLLRPAHARAHGPRAPGPHGADPSRGARLRPDLGAVPEPGPAGGEPGLGAVVERLQLRVEQPDELRRPERAVAKRRSAAASAASCAGDRARPAAGSAWPASCPRTASSGWTSFSPSSPPGSPRPPSRGSTTREGAASATAGGAPTIPTVTTMPSTSASSTTRPPSR